MLDITSSNSTFYTDVSINVNIGFTGALNNISTAELGYLDGVSSNTDTS